MNSFYGGNVHLSIPVPQLQAVFQLPTFIPKRECCSFRSRSLRGGGHRFFKTGDSTTFWSLDLQIYKKEIKQSTSTRSWLNLHSTTKLRKSTTLILRLKRHIIQVKIANVDKKLTHQDPYYITMVPLVTIYEVSLALLQIWNKNNN